MGRRGRSGPREVVGDTKDLADPQRTWRAQGRHRGDGGTDVKDVKHVDDVEDVEDVDVQGPGRCPEVQGGQLRPHRPRPHQHQTLRSMAGAFRTARTAKGPVGTTRVILLLVLLFVKGMGIKLRNE